jgi:hypothetical protein
MSKLRFAIVMALALVVRMVFALSFPAGGGDWDIYSTVAKNIIDGCGVSLSAPNSGECLPHFGGNQLPGYPAFVALVWALFDQSDMAVRIVQILCYLAALAWLMIAVSKLTNAHRLAFAVGILMAISPLQIAWPRFTQTETLALATTMWVAAELLLSLAEKRLRPITLAIALSAAIFIRLDGVLLSVPVAVACFLIYRPVQALRQGALLALIVALPLAGWTIRNVAVGLPSLMPPAMTLPDNAPPPHGYLAWGHSWITEEYQRMGWGYPVTRMVYNAIVIDQRAYDNPTEKAEVELWLNELAGYTGHPFPFHIDKRFARLAKERGERNPWKVYVENNAKRMLALWSNPFSSFAWPNELPGDFGHQARLEVARSGIAGALRLAERFPFEATTKTLTGLYRYGLIAMTLVAILFAMRGKHGVVRAVIFFAMAAMIARTLFFALTNNVETRYTVELLPWMELAVLFAWWGWKRKS